MLDSTTGTTRRRLAGAGIVACLFAAGLAFAVLENTSPATLFSPRGIGGEDEMSTGLVDPVLDPDDCLFDPDALRGLAAVPHTGDGRRDADPTRATDGAGVDTASPTLTGDRGNGDPSVPAGHPATGTDSPGVSGDGGSTEPVLPGKDPGPVSTSPVTPGDDGGTGAVGGTEGSLGGSDGSSPGKPGDGAEPPRTSPHDRSTDSACPGR